MLFFFALIGLITLGIIATVLTETENFGWATLTLIVSVIAAQWFHAIDFLGFVSTHGVLTLLYILGYVGVGIAWSFIKWFSFLMQTRDKYREWKSKFLSGQDLNPDGRTSVSGMVEFRRFITRQSDYSYHGNIASLSDGQRPKAADNKARIVSWMSLWPCSVIGTLLNDPVRRLFNLLFNYFKALYQKMSDSVFKNDLELK